ncbi:hypothetical protein WAI453_012131 [Rhynchosporium graminicola]
MSYPSSKALIYKCDHLLRLRLVLSPTSRNKSQVIPKQNKFNTKYIRPLWSGSHVTQAMELFLKGSRSP